MTDDQKQEHEQETSLLRRWSERKANVLTEQQNELELPQAPTTQTADAGIAPLQADIEAERQELTDADMPLLESLDEKSDVSMFFSPKVSAGLRRMALRKIFHLPVYNIRDGLNDYDEDYTTFEPLGDIVTADMKHMREVAERKRREREEAQIAEQQALAEAEQQRPELESEPELNQDEVIAHVDGDDDDGDDNDDSDDEIGDADLEDDIA